MSIWSPRRASKPLLRADPPWQPTFPFTYGQVGRGYQDIDPTQGEVSLQSVAFRAGADLIASIVSELPLGVYSGDGAGRRKRNTPGYLEDPAGDGYGREDWVYQFILSWILRGNGFAGILDQGPTGMVRQASIFHPDTVSVTEINGRPEWRVSGETIPSREMLHKRVNPVPGTLMGLSVVQAHASTIGLSLQSTAFGRTWFQDGGHPGGILSNDQADLSDDKIVTKAKDRFMAALFGVREPVVLGKGWKFEQIQVSPEESQFLGTQEWSAAESARILGPGVAEILGYATGGSMTYANVIDRDVTLLKYTVGKWVNRIERLFFGWLPRPQYAILDRDAFLETSAMQRWAINKIKLDTGAYVIDEIREKENDGPVPWGKEPMSLTVAAATKPDPAPEPDPNDPPTDPAPPTGGE